MKKIFYILLIFLLSISLVEATISLSVSWQLSTETLRPGGDATISLTFTNAGTTALTNVIAKPTPGPYVEITSGSKIELGGISATTSQQGAISIKVDEDAPSTTSYIYLEIDYYTGTSDYEKNFYIPITIKRKPLLEIKNVKYSDSVEPGKTLELSFEILNSGDGTAKDLQITLNQSDLFTTISSSGETLIDSLDPSEHEVIKFDIIINPDASVGIDSIPVKLTYYDETKETSYSETKYIGISISGTIEFITTFESGENFYYGNIGEAEITISNSGTGSAEYVTVKTSSDYGSKEFYIGSLDSDDSETIDLVQDLRRATGKYPITLEISYKDKFQNSYSLVKVVEAMPTNAPTDYTIIIIIIVVAGIGFWYYRKRKKK